MVTNSYDIGSLLVTCWNDPRIVVSWHN